MQYFVASIVDKAGCSSTFIFTIPATFHLIPAREYPWFLFSELDTLLHAILIHKIYL